MNQSVVCCRPLTVILFIQSGKLTGISLPDMYTLLPCLRLPKDTPLGHLTGQHQSDGEGNTTRVEVEMSTVLLGLCLCYGRGWMIDSAVRAKVWVKPSQNLCIWVKPSDLQVQNLDE